MSESVRSFIAFDVESSTVLNRISSVQNRLLQTGADLKLVEPQNIHITLRFLGNLPFSMIEKVFEEMKHVKFTPFTMQLKGIGAFPDLRYPRVIWIGITEGADQLKAIVSQLEPRMRRLGFAPDSKGFSPHLTIARVRSGKNKVQLANFIVENANYEFGAVSAERLRLKKSDLTPKGPIYSTLKEVGPQQ
ncbi:MAG: RNA 2',3'-cyclic phosphodiesterase [Candidatus Bathyarchaeota archaeon]|nr:RNA 2',3'-cyclic phosphodiesterase [Candidatus Bathyarchaeota archaeon]